MVPKFWRIQDFECTEDSEDEWIDQTGRIVLLGEAAWRSLVRDDDLLSSDVI